MLNDRQIVCRVTNKGDWRRWRVVSTGFKLILSAQPLSGAGGERMTRPLLSAFGVRPKGQLDSQMLWWGQECPGPWAAFKIKFILLLRVRGLSACHSFCEVRDTFVEPTLVVGLHSSHGFWALNSGQQACPSSASLAEPSPFGCWELVSRQRSLWPI